MLQFVMNCIDPVMRRRMYLKWQRNNESYRFVTFNIIVSINACDVKCFSCVFLFAALFVFCKCCLIFSDLKVYFLQAVCVALLFLVSDCNNVMHRNSFTKCIRKVLICSLWTKFFYIISISPPWRQTDAVRKAYLQ